MNISNTIDDIAMTAPRQFPKHWGQVCGSCIHFTAQPFGATCMRLGGGRAFEGDSAMCCSGSKKRKD